MNSYPLVSIILPIRNEEKTISNTLDSIIEQDYNFDNIEIIISDGISGDRTLSIIQDYKTKFNNILILKNDKKTVSTGFNLALNEANGDIIVRVDGHTTIAFDYITRCVEKLKEKSASNVGGLMRPNSKTFLGKLIVVATSSIFGIGNSYFHFSNTGRWVDTVYLGAWKRSVFSDIGGFDEDLVRNQDDEFNFRLIQNGGRIWLDPSIKSNYIPRAKISKLFSQYFQYGFYKVRVMQKRRGLSSYRQLAPPAFTMSLIISIICYQFSILPIFILASAYCPLSVFFSLVSTNKIKRFFFHRLSSFMLFPIIFLTLHLSYGLGYLFGFIYFIKKWSNYQTTDDNFNLKKFNSSFS